MVEDVGRHASGRRQSGLDTARHWWYGSAAADVASRSERHYPGIQIFDAFTTEAPDGSPSCSFELVKKTNPL
jgi:hypothetical protein